jgi:DNA repair protein RadC
MNKSKSRNERAIYPLQYESVVFGLGLIPEQGVPEIKITYKRTRKEFLGKVTHSKDVADFIRRTFRAGTLELQESFITLYLNTAHEILGYYNHSVGGINTTIADRRLILATALASASIGIVVAHNHPSGNLKPSQSDLELTKRLKEGAETLDIKLMDHLIITKNGYYSFADEGII